MPCRPPEYDLGLKDGKRAEKQAASFIEQRKQLQRVLREYHRDRRLNLRSELRKKLEDAVFATHDPLPPRPGSAESGRYPKPVHGSWALEMMYRAHHEERKLCEERSLLMELAALRSPSPKAEADFNEQLRAHRLHRREDLEALRSTLRRQIASLENWNQASPETLAELRSKLERAEALTVDDILDDRDELESLWPGR